MRDACTAATNPSSPTTVAPGLPARRTSGPALLLAAWSSVSLARTFSPSASTPAAQVAAHLRRARAQYPVKPSVPAPTPFVDARNGKLASEAPLPVDKVAGKEAVTRGLMTSTSIPDRVADPAGTNAARTGAVTRPSREQPVRTSDSHPLQVSWLFPSSVLARPPPDPLTPLADLHADDSTHVYHRINDPLPSQSSLIIDLLTDCLRPITPDDVPTTPPRHGNIGMSSCPGKKVRVPGLPNADAVPSTRPPVRRELDSDFPRLFAMGVRMVVCCLYDDEMARIGAPWTEYARAAQQVGVEVVRMPMYEGYAPARPDDLAHVLAAMNARLTQGDHVLIHCRGGIGRAAVVACAYLLRYGWAVSALRAIRIVRARRSRRAVETAIQGAVSRRLGRVGFATKVDADLDNGVGGRGEYHVADERSGTDKGTTAGRAPGARPKVGETQ
ncbi:hypothetical protein AMAG_14708 [Allomyces macrogynus ATCC 38327]|uniref:protein-tyrosine-phosphatase n=1 Tax=Allomyces macrogynus (strain ATCC 38327) TaxID=578462 RepID=A0A0L0T763_ALLM3|nr:hypothetical protein AMAG_14708 [Allomyces macrogynus ATCC 38327]|eukprot:KNE70582.1 hypothetical protein AMAG_14708 [Allomyces macrogynus ATCC 38327]